MKKFMLLFTCSFLAATAARALTASDQLNAVKDIFNQEFKKIDKDKDGVISSDEYMLYQFELLQKSFADAANKQIEKTDDTQKEEVIDQSETPVQEEKKPNLATMSDTTATLQDMANYEVSFESTSSDEPNYEDEEWYMKPDKLTKEDVMPEIITEDTEEIVVPEIDLSISEEENLKNVLANMVEEDVKEPSPEKTEEDKQKDEKQIKFIMDTIKKSLPKKIDNITTWTDIVYKDNVIDYVYEADVDVNKFTDFEKKSLKENIEKVACAQAYDEMCKTIKPMFIDNGINMKIRYYDKTKVEISYCEFNNETCK